MSQFYLQQNVVASCDEGRSMVSISELSKGPLVCPKPRQVGIRANNCVCPLVMRHMSHQADGIDNEGAELVDIIHKKEENDSEKSATRVASSPPSPYFCGSPPARAENPLIHDPKFRAGMVYPMSPSSVLTPSSSRKGGSSTARMKYGLMPAAVRVEGFDCLNRDNQNSRITAMA